MKEDVSEGVSIEEKSFELIEERLKSFEGLEREIVKRVVHATADFNFGELIEFHGDAVKEALKLLQKRPRLITDVNMVRAGIRNSPLLKSRECFIADPRVKEYSEAEGITRARAAFRSRADEVEGSFVVIGNSPTALFEVVELIDRGVEPGFVVAAPVGFVGAEESKEEILKRRVPSIAVRGPRGGSTVAVAITNALIIMAEEREGRGE